MEIKTGISLQTKQVLSQMQVESLNILAMSMTELKDFLQKEEIENPLLEFSAERGEEAAPVTYKETERFYNGTERESSRENELYEIEDNEKSIEDLVNMQLHWKKISETDRKIVDFCVQSIEQSGYFLIQVQGMDEEETLSEMIKHHLQNIAEGKISTISRALKLSSAEVRKMIHVIKGLNPRPLNGIGGDKAQYIVPDVLLSHQDGVWNIELNDKWTGNLQSNDYYIHMMETAQDQELKSYFENKLRRARFIINAVEQRRETLTGITREILKRQEPYFLGTGQLKPMTLEEIADALEIHKSTVSRAIRDKYLRAPSGCFLFRSLFTTGIPSGDGNGDVSRNAVKAKLKELVAAEDKKKPWSDEQLAGLLQDAGMPISRRTVAKYRMELGIGGAFQRKDG